MEENKPLKVVPGDGTNLNISPVYDHISDTTPTSQDKRPKNIVIPQVNKDKKAEKKSEEKKESE